MYLVLVRAPALRVDWRVPNKKWDRHLPTKGDCSPGSRVNPARCAACG
jgi:hypothetical protein